MPAIVTAAVLNHLNQDPIVPTPAYATLVERAPVVNRTDLPLAPGADMLDPAMLSGSDWLLAVRPEAYQGRLPSALVEVARSGTAVLYRIRHADR